MNDRPLTVICLCAAWCGSCSAYRATFDNAAASFGAEADFTWIDIEDDAALVDDVEVENFPTLLLARGTRPVFFGTITPQPGTLTRLVQSALDGEPAPPADTAPLIAFLDRLRAA